MMQHFPNKILLMGYMASGKTTVGKKLAQQLNRPFVDLDHYIEGHEKMSVAEIFDRHGELYFRKKELFFLKELLTDDASIVLSLGGGTPLLHGAMDLILQYSESIYLKATVQTLYERLKLGEIERPLLSKIAQDLLQEYIGSHLFERSHYYLQASHVIEIDQKTPDQIVEELIALFSYDK